MTTTTLLLLLSLTCLSLVGTAQQKKISDEKAWELEEKLGKNGYYWNRAQYDQAFALIDSVLKVAPDFVPALLDKARTYMRQGKADWGEYYETLFAKIIHLAPKSTTTWISYAGGYEHHKNYEAAYEIYTQAIEAMPNNADLYDRRGGVLRKMDKQKEAIDDYSKAIAINPKLDGTYSSRAWAWKKLGNYDKAMADLDQAIALAPNDPEHYDSRAWLKEYNLEDYHGALADYKRAYRRDSTNKSYLNNIDMCKSNIAVDLSGKALKLFLKRDYYGAIRKYEKALHWGLSGENAQRAQYFVKTSKEFIAKQHKQDAETKQKAAAISKIYQQGKALYTQKKYTEAFPLLKQAYQSTDFPLALLDEMLDVYYACEEQLDL